MNIHTYTEKENRRCKRNIWKVIKQHVVNYIGHQTH